MAALAVILVAAAALVLIAKYEGVDVGSLAGDLKDQINSDVAAVGGDLGVASDPLSLALPIIKNFEKFSAKAYPDPPGSGKFSIAWGHQIQPGEPYDQNSEIGRDEGDQLLRTDAGAAYACVTSHVSVDLTPNQTAALISFCYNVGCGAFASSSMLRDINAGDFESAALQFPAWIHAGGQVSATLVDRRRQEQELFNT